MLDLRSKARQQRLAYYFTNPAARHHLRDLARRLSIDPSNLSKDLGRLERDGICRSEMIGRQQYFQLNRKYPPFDEVRKIVAKTIGAAHLIAQSLKTIDGIDEAYGLGRPRDLRDCPNHRWSLGLCALGRSTKHVRQSGGHFRARNHWLSGQRNRKV